MEFAIFFITATIAIIGAVGMLLSRNAVHSVLFLLLNFAAIAVLFLLLRASFLTMTLLAVYAGAIMVLFLFVVMLLGAEYVEGTPDQLGWQRWLALILALVLLIEALVVSTTSLANRPDVDPAVAAVLDVPADLGMVLFTTYLLPIQVTGIILLVAIVGVVVLNQRARMQEASERQS